MTAQPAQPWADRPWAPDPVRQRLANYTFEDIMMLPEDMPRVELRDGVLIVVPSPTLDHQDIGNLLWTWFRQNAPREFRPGTAVGVNVSDKDTLEPDVVLLRRSVTAGHHFFPPEQVAIAVEIVSSSFRERDRFEKPAEYAAAGVPFYWRIEQDPVHVYAYELGANGSYELVADSDTELVLSRPFEIALPISAITP